MGFSGPQNRDRVIVKRKSPLGIRGFGEYNAHLKGEIPRTKEG
jgi:hypothetical protein